MSREKLKNRKFLAERKYVYIFFNLYGTVESLISENLSSKHFIILYFYYLIELVKCFNVIKLYGKYILKIIFTAIVEKINKQKIKLHDVTKIVST